MDEIVEGVFHHNLTFTKKVKKMLRLKANYVPIFNGQMNEKVSPNLTETCRLTTIKRIFIYLTKVSAHSWDV